MRYALRVKALITLVLAALVASAFFAIRSWQDYIRGRIAKLENADSLLQKMKDELSTPEGCVAAFSPVNELDLSQLAKPDGKIPLSVRLPGVDLMYLTNLVDLGSADEGRAFQARLKLKTAAKGEHAVALLRIITSANGKVSACLSSESTGLSKPGSPCEADNSPDPKRAGGKGNLVPAPEGTLAVSGPYARPVFAFDGVVKWLPSGACGPVNFCQGGLWTTVSIVPCVGG